MGFSSWLMTRPWLILLLLCCVPALHSAPFDLLLIAADNDTLRPVLKQLNRSQVEKRAAWTFWRGELHGKTTVVARSEGDPLNAVAVTTLAVRLYSPRLIVVFGVARSHDPQLRPGDTVVSERLVAFDGMISPPTELGRGSNALLWTKRPHPLMTVGERETPAPFFEADAAALALAKSLKTPTGRVVVGTLGSANQVNREADRVTWLREQWKTSTEDHESAHVAGVAALLGVPVIGFRIVEGEPAAAAEFTLRFVEAWK
jgi:adenosylhomocysteine nucleosidase